MKVYTYSEARQHLAEVLEQARRDGEVWIRRRTGQMFVVKPEAATHSPLDVEGVNMDITTQEIVDFVRESREWITSRRT
ncbi:MAG: type II toxin-antitoxin system prevent-host-death family antitoxin [Thermaerobacter sp.]|nr:type II toxin-antitoxin system prevent-host-death family antitoxin [Thermaerobacter sp.]